MIDDLQDQPFPGVSHLLSPPGTEQPRERVLQTLRAIKALDADVLAEPFLLGGGRMLEGFRGVLALRESSPTAAEELADLVTAFDPDIDRRLALLAETLPDHQFFSIRDVIDARGYRVVHNASLGAGTLLMWNFNEVGAERHWRHGMAAGILAELAIEPAHPERDQAFAAGLLHGLGSLALRAAGVSTPAEVTMPEFVDDAAGRRVAEALTLPLWLHAAIAPCELGGIDRGELASAVHQGCTLAMDLGYTHDSRPSRYVQPAGAEQRDLLARLEAEGGRAWLDARVRSMNLAATGDLSALSVAVAAA